jgi:hypothetical protein
MGPCGLIALSTAIDDGIMSEVISATEEALDRMARAAEGESSAPPQEVLGNT